jgi:mono/diheme cytochrome c family protein
MKSLLLTVTVLVLCTGIGVNTITAQEKGDAAKGKALYDTNCTACHGPEGKGDGVAAQALDPKPRDLSNAEFTSSVTNEHLYKVISEGGPAAGLSPLMAAWGGILSEAEIWDVIAFIRQDVCKCKYEKK